jgi:hypothetical protein
MPVPGTACEFTRPGSATGKLVTIASGQGQDGVGFWSRTTIDNWGSLVCETLTTKGFVDQVDELVEVGPAATVPGPLRLVPQ